EPCLFGGAKRFEELGDRRLARSVEPARPRFDERGVIRRLFDLVSTALEHRELRQRRLELRAVLVAQARRRRSRPRLLGVRAGALPLAGMEERERNRHTDRDTVSGVGRDRRRAIPGEELEIWNPPAVRRARLVRARAC